MASNGRRTSPGARNKFANRRSNLLNCFSIRRTTSRPVWTGDVQRFLTSPRHPHHTGVRTGRYLRNGCSSGTSTATLKVSTSSTARRASKGCRRRRTIVRMPGVAAFCPTPTSGHQRSQRPPSTKPTLLHRPWLCPLNAARRVAGPAIVGHNVPIVPSSTLPANQSRGALVLWVRIRVLRPPEPQALWSVPLRP